MSKIIKKDEFASKSDLTRQVEKRVTDIKSSGLIHRSSGVINKKVLAADDEARGLINEAREEAEQIREEAKKMLEDVGREMARSKEEGYRDGQEDGKAEATERIVAAKKMKDDFFRNAEPEIIRLVMLIAEKVIGRLVAEHQSVVASIVGQAIDSSLGEKVTVKLNPEDYKNLAGTNSLSSFTEASRHIIFREDDAIERGGCIVETEVGIIDARLETQLKAIRKALKL